MNYVQWLKKYSTDTLEVKVLHLNVVTGQVLAVGV